MNDKITISCTIGTTDPAASIGLEIWVDNTKLFDTDHVSEQLTLEWQLAEDDADHDLRFIMKNKTSEHTLVDDSGQIVEDARLVIHDICFDKISLGQLDAWDSQWRRTCAQFSHHDHRHDRKRHGRRP